MTVKDRGPGVGDRSVPRGKPGQGDDLATAATVVHDSATPESQRDLGVAATLVSHDTGSDPRIAAGIAATVASQERRGATVAVDRDGGAVPVPIAEPARGDLAASLVRGAAVGEFLVVDLLGAGGMGVVVSAYDPQLDRKVAIKVLRPELVTEGSPSRGEQRLLREAQAMAKLSHPNVITVYEVGAIAGQVFVVMEYVDGRTLGQWLAAEPRRWREVVEVFTQAGRGLAAAHAAGLVHRDFKPDNVLIDESGRVRVTDFGLVGTVAAGQRGGAPAVEAVETRARAADESALSTSLTRTGAVMGTPLYMAPEQHGGTVADHRADQFSFCVSLYEALYHQRPFAGDTIGEIASNVAAGQLREPPRDAAVPARLRAILTRGLATDPERRFASMDPLLAELGKDPAQARRRAVVVVAVAALIAVAGFGVLRSTEARSRCAGAADELAGVWDGAARDRVRQSFQATGRPYAATTFDRVAIILDGYSARWRAMWIESCEATHVHHVQSAQLLDLRMHCLHRRRDEMKALVDLLASGPDEKLLDRAINGAQALVRLSDCADTAALAAVLPSSLPPELRAEVDGLRQRLAQALALQNAARYEEGVTIAAEVAAAAGAIEDPAIRAEAGFRLGALQRYARAPAVAEATLLAAAEAAAAARDDQLAARIWTETLFVVGYLGGRFADIEPVRAAARAAVARARDDDELTSGLQNAEGAVLMAAGQYAEARGYFERALAIRERALGPDDLAVAAAANNLAVLLGTLGERALARSHLERSLAVREAALGADHPSLVGSLINLGGTVDEQGEHELAMGYFQRALAISEAAFGPDHLAVADCLNSIGISLKERGKAAEAIALIERALVIRERAPGKDPELIASTLSNLGMAHYVAGDYEAARGYLERALELRRAALGPDHPTLSQALNNLGLIYKRLGRFDDALAAHRRVIEIREKAFGPTHGSVADAINNIAFMNFGRGRYAEARVDYERALAIYDQSPESVTRVPALIYYARTLDHLGETQAAAAAFRRAVEIAEAQGNPSILVSALVAAADREIDRDRPAAGLPLLERAKQAAGDQVERQAEVDFAIARARWATGRDRAGAIDLAAAARDRLAGAGVALAELAEIDAWLAARRR